MDFNNTAQAALGLATHTDSVIVPSDAQSESSASSTRRGARRFHPYRRHADQDSSDESHLAGALESRGSAASSHPGYDEDPEDPDDGIPFGDPQGYRAGDSVGGNSRASSGVHPVIQHIPVAGAGAGNAAGAGGAAVLEDPVFRYVPLSEDIKDSQETELSDNPDWCYWCECCDDPKQAGTNPFTQWLQQFWIDRYGSMAASRLTEIIQTHYNAEIRPYIEPAHWRRPWYRRVILEHIEHHAPTSRVDDVKHLRLLRELIDHQSGCVVREDVETHEKSIDQTGLRKFKDLMIMYNKIRTTSAGSSSGNSGGRSKKA